MNFHENYDFYKLGISILKPKGTHRTRTQYWYVMDGKVRNFKPCLCYAYLTISGVVHANMNLKVDLTHNNSRAFQKNLKNGHICMADFRLYFKEIPKI